MKLTAFIALCLSAAAAMAAPANYPLTINSRADTAPDILMYRASEKTFALTFVDGGTTSDITAHTVWMSWSTSNTAASVVTATCAVVSGSNGTATATFSGAQMNYTPGTYIYEVGVTSGGSTKVYRQGVLKLVGSPYASGGTAATWTTNQPWSLITGTPTTFSGYGITGDQGELILKTQYLYYVSATNCSGLYGDATHIYFFRIAGAVRSVVTNTIP